MPGTKKSTAASESLPVEQSPTEKLIGKRIRRKRELLGYNFEQLAALTREYDANGIAAVTLRRYEREDKSATLPGLRELRILCDALDLSADYLLRGQENAVEEYTQDLFEQFRNLVKVISREDGIPSNSRRHPDWARIREEKLRRARLHTKIKDE